MNLALLLETVAAMHPDRVAISEADTQLTFADLRERAASWGAWLREQAGDGPVVYVGQMRRILAELLFGSALAGRPLLPVNYRVKQAEFEYFLAMAQPALVIADARYHEVLATAAAATDVGAPLLDTTFTPPPPPHEPEPEMNPAAPAVYLFTSGTTAAAKLVALTHLNLTGYVLETVPAGAAAEDEAALVSTPPYHIAGIANLLTTVFRGRRIVLLKQFDPLGWLETVQAERVTHAMVVPTMLGRILDVLAERADLAPTSLRQLAYGGAKAPEGLIERALALFPGGVGLVNAYGLTETSSTITLLGPEEHRRAFASEDPAIRSRLASVGRPLPGVRLKVVRGDGTDAAPDEKGEIVVSGRQVSSGYVGGRLKVDEQGWLHTGDLGFLDAEGFVFVSGRADDIIIRGGENIAPDEIEAALRSHAAVTDAVVVGLPDPDWGEVVGALAVGDESVEEAALQDWVRGQVAGYKVPSVIRWVEEIPRNDMGKVFRRRARELLGS